MFQIFTCLTVEHDWRLVVLAAAVCLLASGVAISLFHRARAAVGRARFVWLSLARIMHQAERFCTSGRRSCACDPPVWIGVRQLGVQRV
jgi:hypothetical protein